MRYLFVYIYASADECLRNSLEKTAIQPICTTTTQQKQQFFFPKENDFTVWKENTMKQFHPNWHGPEKAVMIRLLPTSDYFQPQPLGHTYKPGRWKKYWLSKMSQSITYFNLNHIKKTLVSSEIHTKLTIRSGARAYWLNPRLVNTGIPYGRLF